MASRKIIVLPYFTLFHRFWQRAIPPSSKKTNEQTGMPPPSAAGHLVYFIFSDILLKERSKVGSLEIWWWLLMLPLLLQSQLYHHHFHHQVNLYITYCVGCRMTCCLLYFPLFFPSKIDKMLQHVAISRQT